MNIGDRKISSDVSPFIVAEISANHNGSLDRCLETIKVASECGVDAVKIQTYTADTMTVDCNDDRYIISDKNSPWFGRKLYELYQEAHTPWEWHKEIFKYCKEIGVVCFSSPFDETAVDFLETLDCPAYKIASFEITDLNLIRKVASTGKPVIISTGMGKFNQIADAVDAAKGVGGVALLKCTSAYPADATDANLLTIPDMEERFGCPVGLSDHSKGIGVSVASVALGAVIIEKHMTMDRSKYSADAHFSMEPKEMHDLVDACNQAHNALGRVYYGPKGSGLNFMRSIIVTKDIKKGENFTKDNVKCLRPNIGLEPHYMGMVLESCAMKDLKVGDPVTFSSASLF